MGVKSVLGKIAKYGSLAAIPFTGGASALIPAASWVAPTIAGASSLLSGLDSGGGGSGGGDSTDLTKYSRMLGDKGQSMLDTGTAETTKSRNLFTPITQRNSRLMSGDMNTINDELRPEMDAIGQQFANVRNMISDQPRGGGKTSTLAQLPIEQIKLMGNLVSQERSKAADTQTNVAGRLLTSGENERDTGLQSLSASGNLALGQEGMGLQRRQQNINIGDKIAETIAELGFLLKGGGGARPTSPYPNARTPDYSPKAGSGLDKFSDPSQWPNMLKDMI